MKVLPALILLIFPVVALGEVGDPGRQHVTGGQDLPPPLDDEDTTNWVDNSHAYATDQAQALTEWMDGFFGDPVYDLEKPESLLRLEWANTWDEQDDHKSRVRLRGKVRLPRLSERVNIIFSEEEGDTPATRDESSRDNAEILVNVGERLRQRFDLTLGINSGGIKPGVRYRNQGPIKERWRYRYTQRLEWEDDEGFYTTGQLNLDHALSETQLIRWSNRLLYGEETLGTEWRTGLSYRQKFETPTLHDPFVVSYFAGMKGFTDPSIVENYRIGMLFRRQIWRRYFFTELEPSYNWRKRPDDEDRDGVWNIVLRFELLFERGRKRTTQIVQAEREAARLHASSHQQNRAAVATSKVFLSESRQP